MVTNDTELKEIKDLFNNMDKNNDGVLDKQELIDGLKKYGYKSKQEID